MSRLIFLWLLNWAIKTLTFRPTFFHSESVLCSEIIQTHWRNSLSFRWHAAIHRCSRPPWLSLELRARFVRSSTIVREPSRRSTTSLGTGNTVSANTEVSSEGGGTFLQGETRKRKKNRGTRNGQREELERRRNTSRRRTMRRVSTSVENKGWRRGRRILGVIVLENA